MSPPFEIHTFDKEAFNKVLENKFLSRDSIKRHNRVIYLERYLSDIHAKSMLVENDYTDGEYLDDFASYYVRCHQDYDRRCKRIHFFDKSIKEDQFLNVVNGVASKKDIEVITNSYLGFIVVRPLPQAIIGRTVIVTRKEQPGDSYTCVREYDVNLFGIKLTIKRSLAFQEQDTVIAACATVALWCCFHKTAQMFGTPAPRPADITRVANQVIHPSRSFPSRGLNIQQMCDAIGQVGLEPEVIDMNKNRNDVPLVDLIYSYLKMGLPVILGAEVEGRGLHAITLLGFSIGDESVTKKRGFSTVGSRINRIYAHDDQSGPFSEIRIQKNNNPEAIYPTILKCTWEQLSENSEETLFPSVVIIPVYNKIRVTFIGIQKWINCLHDIIEKLLASQISSTEYLEWDTYISTSNELKSCLKQEVISERDREKLFLWPHPRFIWRATLSYREKISNGTYRENKIADFFADATDIPHGFPIYQSLWYQEDLRIVLNEYLTNSKNINILLSKVKEPQDLDKYRKLIEFMKNNTIR
jgi:hypothetical protein